MENMRTYTEEKKFTEHLFRVGEHKEEVFEDVESFAVTIPDECIQKIQKI